MLEFASDGASQKRRSGRAACHELRDVVGSERIFSRASNFRSTSSMAGRCEIGAGV